MSDCRDELKALLKEDRLAGATLLVFANKQDLEGSMRTDEIRDVSFEPSIRPGLSFFLRADSGESRLAGLLSFVRWEFFWLGLHSIRIDLIVFLGPTGIANWLIIFYCYFYSASIAISFSFLLAVPLSPFLLAVLKQALDLPSIHSHRWLIQPCSAYTGENLLIGLDWLVKDVAERVYYSTASGMSAAEGKEADIVAKEATPLVGKIVAGESVV